MPVGSTPSSYWLSLCWWADSILQDASHSALVFFASGGPKVERLFLKVHAYFMIATYVATWAVEIENKTRVVL